MTDHTVDAVAMSRYLVGKLPTAADEVFKRAENDIDVIEAPSVTVSEAVYTAAQRGTIVGVAVDTTSNAVVRGIV